MGFKTLIIASFITLAALSSPVFVHANDSVPEENATGGDSTEGDEKEPQLTPEQQAELIKAKKAEVESRVRVAFNKTGTTDVKVYVGRIIAGAMGLLGSLTLVMFVYSGLLWMTATGDAGKVEKARDIAVWSSLGLLVIFSSYAILRFVLDIFPQV